MYKYQRRGLIYSNNQGRVQFADNNDDRNRYVLKFVNKVNKKSAAVKSYERQILAELIDHQNIVFMKQAFDYTENNIQYEVIVLEYCSEGNLAKLIEENDTNKYDLVRRLELFMAILQGLKLMHSKNIIHRDIKPENIIMSRGIAKIGDFGSAINLKKNVDNLGKRIGTKWYMSPQVYQSEKYGLQADIWSLGLLLLQLCINKRFHTFLPGLDAPCQRKSFHQKEKIQLLQLIKNEKLKKVVTKMLNKKPELRIKLQDIQKRIRIIHRDLLRLCALKYIKVELPLIIDEQESNSSQSNEQQRIDPRKRQAKIDKYKMRTTQQKKIVVFYNDHLEQLTLKYEKQNKIIYNYKILPQQIKQICKNLSQLNIILKSKHNKIVHQSHGSLSFDHNLRLPYNQLQSQKEKDQQKVKQKQSIDMSLNSSKDESYISQIQLSKIQQKSRQSSKILSQLQSDYIINDSQAQSSIIKNQGQSISMIKRQNNQKSSSNILPARIMEPEVQGKGKKIKFMDLQLQEKNSQEEKKEDQSNQDSNQISNQIVFDSSKEPSQRSREPSQKGSSKFGRKKGNEKNPDFQTIKEEPNEQPTADPQLPKKQKAAKVFSNPFDRSNPGNQVPNPQTQLVSHPQGSNFYKQNANDNTEQRMFNEQNVPIEQNYDYENSSRLNRQAHSLQSQIAILEKINGPERRLLADHYVRLGKLYKDALNHENAKENLKKGVEKYAQFHMYHSDDCANAILLVGELFSEEGKFDQSLNQYQMALDIKNRIGSNDYTTLSQVYNSIGEAYMRLQNWHFASQSFQQAIGKVKDYFGQEKRMKISPAINLGIVRIKLGEYPEAISILQQALQIHAKHPTKRLFEVLRNLITAHYKLSYFQSGHERLQNLLTHAKADGNQSQQKQIMKGIEEWLTILFEFNGSEIREYLVKLKQYLQKQLPSSPQVIQRIDVRLTQQ